MKNCVKFVYPTQDAYIKTSKSISVSMTIIVTGRDLIIAKRYRLPFNACIIFLASPKVDATLIYAYIFNRYISVSSKDARLKPGS
jgi:hypothetical protein